MELREKLSAPWWLDCLNVITIAVTGVTIALALGASESGPVVEAAAAAMAFFEQPPDSARSFALIASAAALWFGLRHVPFVRAFVQG